MFGLRTPNTTRTGSGFSEATIQAVWEKASLGPGADWRFRRLDRCGAVIDRYAYGQTVPNGTGWEIDHILPVSKGGTDDLSNLQPLQWQNNRRKGDSYPALDFCAVSAAR